MNRVIKFRGKRCKDGEWVYGSYVESNTSWNGHKPHKSWILPSPMTNGGWFSIRGAYPVIDETVCQFTGLVDKNGKEIYEGDIVKCDEFIYKVDYSENRFASFVLLRKQDMFAHFFGEAMEAFECSVMGNIFDNPELWKGGNND